MNNPRESTEDDVTRNLDAVRDVLLGFLPRTYAAGLGSSTSSNSGFLEALHLGPARRRVPRSWSRRWWVATRVLTALVEHLRSRQRESPMPSTKPQHHVQLLMEPPRGASAADFDEASKQELNQRRITFQGTREELLRRARRLTAESRPDSTSSSWSCAGHRHRGVRDEIFQRLCTRSAAEANMTHGMSQAERDTLAAATEARLRCLDRYHVTRLMAQDYPEARRLMDLDALLERYQRLGQPDPAAYGRTGTGSHRISGAPLAASPARPWASSRSSTPPPRELTTAS